MADYNGGQPPARFRSFGSHAKICQNWHRRKLRLGFGRKRVNPQPEAVIYWRGSSSSSECGTVELYSRRNA